MKQLLTLLLIAAIVAGLLAACAGVPVSVADPLPADDGTASDPSGETPDAPPATDAGGEGSVKTGLSVQTSLSSSTAAAGGTDGVIQADITLVAVTVDDRGVIDDCAVDGIQVRIPFMRQAS